MGESRDSVALEVQQCVGQSSYKTFPLMYQITNVYVFIQLSVSHNKLLVNIFVATSISSKIVATKTFTRGVIVCD
jgi:hypothetical protein